MKENNLFHFIPILQADANFSRQSEQCLRIQETEYPLVRIAAAVKGEAYLLEFAVLNDSAQANAFAIEGYICTGEHLRIDQFFSDDLSQDLSGTHYTITFKHKNSLERCIHRATSL